MNIRNIKLWIPLKKIIIDAGKVDGKLLSVCFYGENTTFFDSYNFFGFKRSILRTVGIPEIRYPVRSTLTSDLRSQYLDYKILPYKIVGGDFSKLERGHFYLDSSPFFTSVEKRFDLENFRSARPRAIVNYFFENLQNINTDTHQRVLLYTVDLTKSFPDKLFSRKFFVIFNLINNYVKGKIEEDELPFEKVILLTHDHNERSFRLVFDKYQLDRFSIGKLRSLILSLKPDIEEGPQVDDIYEERSEEIVNDILPKEDITTKQDQETRNNLIYHVYDYLSKNPEEYEDDSHKILRKAVSVSTKGDDKLTTSNVEKQISKAENPKEELLSHARNLIPKTKLDSTSRNTAVKISNPSMMTDYQNPSHIINKRKIDFEETLTKDIEETFNMLSRSDDYPLHIKDMNISTEESGPDELNKTIKTVYNINLEDEKGEEHNVKIELPKLLEDGTFLVNGNKKILINQLVSHPIFFIKPYLGKFHSSYSAIIYESKIVKSGSYILMGVGSFKFPIIMYLSYKLGFDETCKLFNIDYDIRDSSTRGYKKLPNNEYIYIHSEEDDGEQIVESFRKSVKYFPEEGSILNNSFWSQCVENITDNKNAIFVLDNVWENIVTPLEVDILKEKGQPTNIKDITKYICERIVHGIVDDYNDMDKMRVRTTELFTSLLQKQVHSAFSEYRAKRLGGDDDASIYVNPTKIFTSIQKTANFSELENINPIEEISMMTRVTPIGEGFTNLRAFPSKARNIHPSMYGLIDPLETPDSETAGVQQHLAIGALLSKNRGLLVTRDYDNVKDTEILSSSPSLIPFVESNDGARVLMAAGQSKQAIPLANPEVPAVQSGYESVFTNLLSDSFIKKSKVDGEVVEVTDLQIVVRDDKGELHTTDISPKLLRSGQGIHGLGKFTAIVNEGDKVKKDEVLAEGSNIRQGIISNGINLLACFMPWKGYNFEDGMVVSKSAAKKFSSLHMETFDVYLDVDDEVVNVLNIGDTVSKGDILMTYSKTAYDIETYNNFRSGNPGTIANIEIYSNVSEEEIPEQLIPIYKEFRTRYERIHGKYPIGRFKEGGEKFDGILIKFTLEQKFQLTKGDKLNNRSFNKGVVACYDSNTQIMTNNGWKYFYELTKDDKVLYMKDNGKAGFIKPEKFFEYNYEGDVYGSDMNINFLVTPEHNMYYRCGSSLERKYKFKKVEDLDRIHDRSMFYITNVNFDFKEDPEKYITISCDRSNGEKQVVSINKTDFYELYGWLVTDGCLYTNKNNHNKIIITQSKETHKQKLELLLERTELTWTKPTSEKDNNYVLSSKAVFEYLKNLGSLGKSYDKFIPEWMFDTSRENLEKLFESIIKGDGSKTTTKNLYCFHTTSKRLMDNFVRLCTLLGYRTGKINTETKNRKRPKYTVYVNNCREQSREKEVKSHHIFTEHYQGKVYCVQVPNNLVFVKRNGMGFWCGNSIEDDENMPMTPWGDRVEIIYNPLSVINRMNSGQLLELTSGLAARRLAIMMENQNRKVFTKNLSDFMELIDNTDGKVYKTNVINAINKMSDRAYEKFKNQVTSERFYPLIFPPFKTPDREDFLKAMNKIGIKAEYSLTLPEFGNKKSDPVSVGYMYVMKLEHISEKKITARSIGPYVNKINAPTQGKRREGGQLVGEYDLVSLLAYDANVTIDEFFGALSSDHGAKNELITDIVHKGEAEFRPRKVSPEKELYSQYMRALHLSSE